MTGESNLLRNGPQLERGKEAKNHLGENSDERAGGVGSNTGVKHRPKIRTR